MKEYRRSGAVIALWVLSGGWSVGATYGALAMTDDLSLGLGAGVAAAVLTIFVGFLPGTGVLWYDKTLERRYKRADPQPIPARPAVVGAVPLPAPMPQLPGRLYAPWYRLTQAWNVVGELQRRGWIDLESTRGLPESIARLHRLGVADGMTDQLGGRRSDSVARQIDRLADLMVALADEAVEHQAALGAGDFTPATLVEAAQRLAADSAAYRELMELSGTWAAPEP